MEPKAWYESKTILLNLATLIALALALPDVVAIIPATWMPYVTAVNAILNVWLRLGQAAQQPVTLRKQGPQ